MHAAYKVNRVPEEGGTDTAGGDTQAAEPGGDAALGTAASATRLVLSLFLPLSPSLLVGVTILMPGMGSRFVADGTPEREREIEVRE